MSYKDDDVWLWLRVGYYTELVLLARRSRA